MMHDYVNNGKDRVSIGLNMFINIQTRKASLYKWTPVTDEVYTMNVV